MISNTRRRLINIWRKIAQWINELCDDDCAMIPDTVLDYGAKAIIKPIKDAKGEDGMHISDVADHFGVCNKTIKNWLHNASLPPPKKKEDYDTTYIPLDTFEKLKEYRKEINN